MDQHYMQIIQDLTEKVNDLSEIVRQGFPQRQTLDVQVPECDDIHRRTVVPAVEIESFPELLELIPDLEKDFFRIPLAEKARKDIIYGCPKFTGMNYQPPPLKETAPTSVKRTDAMLYKIQKSLASLTRPLDHYMYEQIRQRRLVDLDNDGDIILVETMRTMLADLASTITQDRIDNMHKIMDLPGRAPQLVESRSGLNGRVPLISASSHGTATPLQRRQSSKLPQPNTSPTPPTIKEVSSRERGAKNVLKRVRIRALSRANYVLPRWRTPRYVSGHLGETYRRSMGEEHSRERVCDSVQESNPEQKSPEKGKFTQASKGECRSAADASTFGKRLMEVLHTRGHGRGSPADAPSPSFQEEDDPGGERGHHKGGISSLVEESYRGGEGESPRVLQQPLHDPKEDGRPPPSIGSSGAQQPCGGALLQDADPDIRMQDDQEEELNGVPGLGRRLHACSNPPDVQKIPEVCMERGVQGKVLGEHREIVFPVDQPGIQNQHEEVETDTIPINISFGDGNQFQIDELKGPQGQDQRSPQGSEQTSEDGQDDVEMSGELHWESSSNVNSPPPWTNNVDETSRIEEQFAHETEKRTATVHLTRPALQNLEFWRQKLQKWNCQSFIPETPEMEVFTDASDTAWGIVVGSKSYSGTWPPSQIPLHINEKEILAISRPLRLSQVVGKSVLIYSDNTTSISYVKKRSYNDTGNGDHSRPQKRKIPTDGQQTMVAIGVEDHRSSLENQGYNKEAIALLLPKERLNVEEMNIKTYNGLDLDTTPILDRFESDGPSETLTIKDLTSKICWLLAVCGLLRASDIHRIDDIRTIVYDHELRFIIVAPKEKRGGRPIEKQCVVNAHNNKLLCPVYAYKIYKEKVAFLPCPRPHLNDKAIVVNHLFGYSNDNTKPLSVDSISRNI
ncbi:hypothetical protein AYI70_g1131 [Smittium culicis]|uniref:Uncharacterized protein n=1 Tax=Smittium culicis TaxID=133412 RepID=A0A1R1YDY7_9FUNG|nr:hypothetical protein AYI70_g1131 [Smittium culicis]